MDDIVQRGVSSKGIGLGTGSGTVFGQEVCSGVLVTDVKVNIFSLFLHDVHMIPCHTISCLILLCHSIQYNITSYRVHIILIVSYQLPIYYLFLNRHVYIFFSRHLPTFPIPLHSRTILN